MSKQVNTAANSEEEIIFDTFTHTPVGRSADERSSNVYVICIQKLNSPPPPFICIHFFFARRYF